jgi:hypothetical protein
MESRRPERLRAWSEAAEAALMTPASFASVSRVDGEDARFLQCSLADAGCAEEARRRSSERRRASRWDVTGMPSGSRLEQSAMQSSAVGGRQSSCSPLRRALAGEVIQLGEAPSVGPLPSRSRGSAESRLDGGPAGALAAVPDRRQLRDVEVSRLSSTVRDQLRMNRSTAERRGRDDLAVRIAFGRNFRRRRCVDIGRWTPVPCTIAMAIGASLRRTCGTRRGRSVPGFVAHQRKRRVVGGMSLR